MEDELTRKEFVEQFLPEKETIKKASKSLKTVFRLLKYGAYAFIAYLAIRILFTFSISTWGLIGAIFGAFILIGLLASAYQKKKKELIKKNSLHILPALFALEKVLGISTYMIFGALAYKSWLKEPNQAYIMIGMMFILALREEYERRSEQGIAHNVGKRSPLS